MPSAEEITDSTDWLSTSLPSFAPLDAALRCQVCKDFYNTPMITSCSHTFCSLCIRRCLSADGKCPTCRAGDQPSKLRRNWTVQELVDAFATARPQGLELARKVLREEEADETPKRKRRRVGEKDTREVSSTRQTRQTRSSGGRRANNAVVASQETIVLDSEDEDMEEYHPEPEPVEPKDGLVACPMCNKRMKEELVFTHLDRCTADNDDNPLKAQTKPRTPPLQSLPRPIDLTASPANHLPHLNYNLLKDNAFKKKLQELGIPAWGTRQLLIRRHTQWVDLFNANSDSPRPRSNRELLKDLDTWERTQGGNAPGQGQIGSTGVMRKDFDGEEWTGRHKGQFDDLIAAARAKVKIAQSKPAEPGANLPGVESNPSEVKSDPTTSSSKPPDETPISTLEQVPPLRPRDLSDMEALKAEQEAIASQERRMSVSNPSSIPISGAQAFLQHAAEDIPMRDVTPPPIAQEPQNETSYTTPSSQSQRHSAHPDRQYNNNNSSTDHSTTSQQPPTQIIPTSQPQHSLPEKLASPEGTRRVPMFQVPEDPVHDIEGFGSLGGGG